MNTNRSLLVIFAVLLVLGTGISTYVSANSATRVIRDAFTNFREAESFHAAATVATFAPDETVRAAGADPNTTFLPMVFVGEGSMLMPADGLPSGKASFVLTNGQDPKEEVSVEVVAVPNGQAYIRLPQLPASAGSPDLLGALEGKWFDVPERDAGAVRAAWTDARELLTSGEALGGPIVNRGVQKLGELRTRRYLLPIQPEVLAPLSEDVATILRGRALTDEERQEIAVSGLRAGTVELWIDIDSRTIAQASLDLRGIEKAGDETENKIRGSYLTVVLKFAAWNEPVDAPAPGGSEPLPDAVRALVKPEVSQ